MISLLDHGYVQLDDSMGSDAKVARMARVSHAKDLIDFVDREKDEKLIRYLMQHNHSTPFEHVCFTFLIQAPIFVLRQWHRHRTQSYNEVSARYTQMEEVFYVPDPMVIGRQAAKNKQARDLDVSSKDHEDNRVAATMIMKWSAASFSLYNQLIGMKVPRELARIVLPTNVYSRMYMTVDLWNLLKFIQLRDSPDAQYEIRLYAKSLLDLVRPIVPASVAAFQEKHHAVANA